MAKKEWSPEERKAFGEKMRAAKAAKAAEAKAKAEEIQTNAPEMKSTQDLGDLLAQIAELKDNPLIQVLFAQNNNQAPSGPQVTSKGLVGTLEKYIVDPAHYPNPVERLMAEPRLQRFAFKDNFEVDFSVSVSEYDTKDNIHTREPRFTVKLIRIVYDTDSGERTSGRYVVCTGVFHEDPQAAIVVARENGLEVDESNEKVFLDEMRYIRIRNWLLEAFYPAKPDEKFKNKQQKVIGNRLVEFYEVDETQNGGVIDWDKIAESKFRI